jgi:hypothetical protein
MLLRISERKGRIPLRRSTSGALTSEERHPDGRSRSETNQTGLATSNDARDHPERHQELRTFSQWLVASELPSCHLARPRSVPIHRGPSLVTRSCVMKLNGRLATAHGQRGRWPHTIEAKQAELRTQPQIPIGGLGKPPDGTLQKPSRIFHDVSAYWPLSRARFITNARGDHASSIQANATPRSNTRRLGAYYAGPAPTPQNTNRTESCAARGAWRSRPWP